LLPVSVIDGGGMEVRPGYKQTEVGVIPEDWDVIAIGGLFEAKAGGDFNPTRSNDIQSDSYPYPIYANGLSQQGLYGFCNYAEARSGSITVTARGTLGKAFYRDTPFVAIGRLLVLEPKISMDARFFCEYINYGVHFAIESTGVPQLTAPQVVHYALPVPPEHEQHAVAEALSDVDGLLGALEALIAKKQAIKQAIMQQLLTGRTRLPGFSGAWESVLLGNHVSFLKTGTNSRAELIPEGPVKYLHYGDIHTSNQVYLDASLTQMPSLPEERARTLDRLHIGDLVLVDASEDLEGVGKSIEIASGFEIEMVAGLHTIAARFDKSILADSFKAYLQFCPAFRNKLRRLAAGTKVFATNRAHISSVEIELPDIEEQAAIAAVLSDMDAEIAALERRRDKTLAIKQGMMQELLTGKVRLTLTKAGK
jgi:type I restriction enzyme S subunit